MPLLSPVLTRSSAPDPAIPVSLAFESPFAWDSLLAYLERRAIPGVEAVTRAEGGCYWRTMRVNGLEGFVSVGLLAAGESLAVDLSPSLLPALPAVMKRVRRMFDLDLDPAPVDAALQRDPRLAPLVRRRPGLRVPGTVDRFELALRAVLGQQVTVRGASTLAGRLVNLTARPLPGGPPSHGGTPVPLTHLPMEPERLADVRPARLRAIGLPESRVRTVIELARSTARGEVPELNPSEPCEDPAEFERRITQLPGIGPWTAQYILMRALRWSDGFPESDLGLRQAMGGLSPARLRAAAERWRPWRAYAAQHLWASLSSKT